MSECFATEEKNRRKRRRSDVQQSNVVVSWCDYCGEEEEAAGLISLPATEVRQEGRHKKKKKAKIHNKQVEENDIGETKWSETTRWSRVEWFRFWTTFESETASFRRRNPSMFEGGQHWLEQRQQEKKLGASLSSVGASEV